MTEIDPEFVQLMRTLKARYLEVESDIKTARTWLAHWNFVGLPERAIVQQQRISMLQPMLREIDDTIKQMSAAIAAAEGGDDDKPAS